MMRAATRQAATPTRRMASLDRMPDWFGPQQTVPDASREKGGHCAKPLARSPPELREHVEEVDLHAKPAPGLVHFLNDPRADREFQRPDEDPRRKAIRQAEHGWIHFPSEAKLTGAPGRVRGGEFLHARDRRMLGRTTAVRALSQNLAVAARGGFAMLPTCTPEPWNPSP